MAKRITTDAMLTALALVIFVVEAMIPPAVPIPGVKLGLANIITVFAMFTLGPKDTLAILLCRIFLGNLLTGQMVSFLFSLTGGMFCYLIMLLLRKILTRNQIWVCSVIGAVFHNAGQTVAAMLILRTTAVIVYFPLLAFSGIVAGFFTGLAAQLILRRFERSDLYRKVFPPQQGPAGERDQ